MFLKHSLFRANRSNVEAGRRELARRGLAQLDLGGTSGVHFRNNPPRGGTVSVSE